MTFLPRTPPPAPERVERVRAWVEALTSALETGDLDAMGRLFAVECSWQPGPFATVLRGRAAIREHLATRLAGMPGLDTRAEILGAGATHAVIHWSLTWGGDDGRADGILVVAFDAMGRGAAVRESTLQPPTS